MKKKMITSLAITSMTLCGMQLGGQMVNASEQNLATADSEIPLVSLPASDGLEEELPGELPTDPEFPTDPELPEKPTDPEIPIEPEIPVEPEIPTEPETPIEPEVPETPKEPEKPTQPETPIQPEQPKEPQKPQEPAPEKASNEIIHQPTPETPIVTDTGEQIVSVKDGVVYKETAVGLTPFDSAVTALPDGNISIKAADGSTKVLPNTGEVGANGLSILGMGLVSMIGLIWKFKR
ncbi:LPXTG cell wall anchor domain-containing protein [Enterococcus avium]|uniref:LPXTG cell wall anchor domain-containing protein n=1 Tax=Enterococcus avium TaxID=33945 RepID=UPI00288E84B0|nr:LPXTG cell wall anchor domain-containing protein [Enterococcus avium]MDT2499386.1 LPXTG cell wall anchor domain-containing protein [Enterococcus avium]